MGERPSQATFWVRDPGLGRGHGQDGTAARLLPLSVDGLILAASLVLLHEARNDRDAPALARFMLCSASAPASPTGRDTGCSRH